MSANFEEMAKRWWVNAATPELTRNVRNKKIVDALYNAADIMGVDTTGLDKHLKQVLPRKSKRDAENVAYFQNSYKYANDRLTPISSGRFFKTLFPEASDKMTEAFTLFWRDNISFDKEDYKLVISKTRQDFKDAFTKYQNTSSVDCNDFKSISDSCMRYDFDSLTAHPSEVYASGDFEVTTIKSKKGKTRARCVVRVKTEAGNPCYIHGDIYASNNHSGYMIKEYLSSKEGVHMKYSDCWHGAKLLALQIGSRDSLGEVSYICPYIDYARYVLLSGGDTVDNLVITSTEYLDTYTKVYISNGTRGFSYFDTSDDSNFFGEKRK